MIEIDHDPERSPCGIHLFAVSCAACPICSPTAPETLRDLDRRSGPAARDRARERGQARAKADPTWGQSWTPTAIGAGD